jgi:hypothetical protein
VTAKFIQSRILNKQHGNTWMTNLRKAIEEKIVKPIKNKGEAIQMLRVNIQNSDNIIKNIIKANQKK